MAPLQAGQASPQRLLLLLLLLGPHRACSSSSLLCNLFSLRVLPTQQGQECCRDPQECLAGQSQAGRRGLQGNRRGQQLQVPKGGRGLRGSSRGQQLQVPKGRRLQQETPADL